MRFFPLVCLLLALLLQHGCWRELHETDLQGTWVAEYPFGTVTLVLQPGGRYVEEVRIKDPERIIQHSGDWRYEPRSGSLLLGRVFLTKCLAPSDGFGQLRKDYATAASGGCSYPVEREWLLSSRLRLGPGEGNSFNQL